MRPPPARGTACAVGLGVLATFAMLAACGTPDARQTAHWADAVLAADPMFGGCCAFERRVLGSFEFVPCGDPQARESFLLAQREPQDTAAAELVRATADEATARAALAFLRTDAGNAMVAAEAMALAVYAYHGDDFPAVAAARLADHAVGAAAAERLATSHSPLHAAWHLAAMRLSHAEADAVGRFWASPTGQRWLAIRSRACSTANAAYDAFLDRLLELGYVRRRYCETEDLLLPPAMDRDEHR